MTGQLQLTMHPDATGEGNDGTSNRNRFPAPAYRCPGCNVKLVAGGATLEHFNGCKALRELIALGGNGYFAKSAATSSRNEKLVIDEAQQQEDKKVTPRLAHWKTHGPVVSVPAENAAPVDVTPPALIKARKRKSRLRPHRLKPHRLLDVLIEKLSLESDAALAEALQVKPPVISKIRSGRMPIGPSILMRMHEASELPIAKLRALIPEDTRYTETTDEIDEQQKHYG